MTDSTTTPATTEADKQSKVRKAYSAATARIREAHRAEFNTFMAEEAKKVGVEWKPKPTDEEKAAEKLAALLAEHPNLRAQMGLPPEAGEATA